MKKRLLLVASLLCIITMSMAQTLTPIETGIRKKLMAYNVVSRTHEGTEGQHIIYSADLERGPGKGQCTDYIFTVDANENTLSTAQLYRSDDFTYLRSFEGPDAVLVFYLKDSKSNKTYTLYSNLVPKGDKQPKWNPEKVVSVPYEKKDNISIATAVSPDKSKGLICLLQSQRKGEFKGSVLITFDNQGNQLWESNMELNVSNQTFGVIDMAIDNDGKVYAGVYSYDEESKSKRANETITIYEISENDITSQSEPINFSVSNGTMMVGATGNVYLGGYSQSSLKKNEDGAYVVTYNPKSSTITKLSQQEFPENYFDKVVGGGIMLGYLSNDKYGVVVKNLYEFSNGSVVLLGELRTTITVRQQNGMTTTYFFTKNIMTTQVGADGDIVKTDWYDSRAISVGGFATTTYTPLFANDRIYVLFPDNVDNYTKNSGAPFKRVLTGIKKYCCSMVTIDANGIGEAQKLLDAKSCKNTVAKPVFVEEDGFIVIDYDKKNTNISKLKVEL